VHDKGDTAHLYDTVIYKYYNEYEGIWKKMAVGLQAVFCSVDSCVPGRITGNAVEMVFVQCR
jgi:hypothetical protein